MNPIKIFLTEDHKLMRCGLKALFDENEEINVVGEAETGRETLEKLKILRPDVILIDIGLPDMTGIELAKRVLEQYKNIRIIMLTSHLSEQEVNDSFATGANAYVLKDINTEILMMIIKTVNEGAIWIDSKVAPILREKNPKIIPQKQISRAEFKEGHSNLTQREYEVLKLVVDGKSNNEIAKELIISEHTAKAHVCNIIQKLVVDDRTQAAVKALREGLV